MNSRKNKIYKSKPAPLLCWDIYSGYLYEILNQAEDRLFLESFLKYKDCTLPYEIYKCLKIYDAIIITNTQLIIQWVSNSFYNLTGYTKNEAINKQPSFLQGPETSVKRKKEIEKMLQEKSRAVAQLINYRKTGSKYLCEILIEPLFNRKHQLTHFIAFEKEIL